MIQRGASWFEFTTTVGVLTLPTQDVFLMSTNRIDQNDSASAREAQQGNEAAPAPKRVVVSDDEVEAAINRARRVQMSCSECGPRPEPDAVYCSSCGVRLAAR